MRIDLPVIKESGWRPNSNFLRIRRCTGAVVEEHNGDLYYWKGGVCVPQHLGDQSNFAVVVDVGPECKDFTKDQIGDKVCCPELTTGLHRIVGEEFVIREDKVFGFTVVDD